MSVIGIDLGNMNTAVAVARNRGIDVIANEVSNRLSPTMVSFGSKCRYLGEAAKTMEISNLKNTVGQLKRLLIDPSSTLFPNNEVSFDESVMLPMVSVESMGKRTSFSATELLTMHFSYIRNMVQIALDGQKVYECVVAVPSFFNSSHRRILIDAASAAQLNVLAIINEPTAAGLAYCLSRGDLISDDPRYISFVDVGHTCTQVVIFSATRSGMEIKSLVSDDHLGGSDFDAVLCEHFAKTSKTTFSPGSKLHFRLLTAAEKAKRVLSTNSCAVMAIDTGEKDVSVAISRGDFETCVADLLKRIELLIMKAVRDAKIEIEEVSTVEAIGGGTRVPCVRSVVASTFKSSNFTSTMNQDEAVARGAAFMCALNSPHVRVRPFSIKEITSVCYRLRYVDKNSDSSSISMSVEMPQSTGSEHSDDSDAKMSVDAVCEATMAGAESHPRERKSGGWVSLFACGANIPSSRMVKLPRGGSVAVEAFLEGKSKVVGRFLVSGSAKIKASLNLSGLITLSSETAQLETEWTTSRSAEESAKFCKEELVRINADMEFGALESARNSLEERIYFIREEIRRMEMFFTRDEVDSLELLLSRAEEWLYSDPSSSIEETEKRRNEIESAYAVGLDRESRARRLEELVVKYPGSHRLESLYSLMKSDFEWWQSSLFPQNLSTLDRIDEDLALAASENTL